jgi:hypothetical protein
MTEFPNNFDHWNLNIADYLVIVAWYLVLELNPPQVPMPRTLRKLMTPLK